MDDVKVQVASVSPKHDGAAKEKNKGSGVVPGPTEFKSPAGAEQELSYSDEAVMAFCMMLAFMKKPVSPEAIKHEFAASGSSFGTDTLVRAAKRLKLKAKVVTIKQDRLSKFNPPFICRDTQSRFFIFGGAKDGEALIHRPGQRPETLSEEALWQIWDGTAVLITSRSRIAGGERRFDLTWFIPSVAKYRKIFGEVLIASLFLQLFGLVMPLLFQVVMDKVLVHQAFSTLHVVLAGLVIIHLFEYILGGLRSFIFSHTTSKIDVELGARLFDHLLRLPLAYFSTRQAGQVVARVRELETIRSFLTGNALTVVLDLIFSVVFIAVMFVYSPLLTWIVLGSIPFYVILSLLITPSLRARTEETFQRGALNQSFLTEAVVGMETIKSMAVEPQMRNVWEDNLAGYVGASVSRNVLGIFGSQSVQLISKVVGALLLFTGAKLVIGGELTIGGLIAFNMLSGQVAQPILRLAQLWQDFQQFRISLDRLGDVLNSPPESSVKLDRPGMPPLTGKIDLVNVSFRYTPKSPLAVDDLSLLVTPGQTIGIVGRSGSGKSTLTKLVQRLYMPEHGRVLLDGQDISLLDPSWLRRQIGVVLQENTLFNRSIRDNIALADPGMPMERVIQAAQLAGAHEFILELPCGYDTLVEERGSSLSGGQRQRIAIARALSTNPRLLIFDEATSALDYESEEIIQNNMKHIARGRTVLIIAHRLTAVRHADRIITMENGRLIESGTHSELLVRGGRYSELWKRQESGGKAA
ncbi:ATP-binding cassette, subfamily B, HlyB/CyaB [Desulfoluna spongiiphila]|uniref:ATP-binding cassette, subfamily B, HlyB/CyaB n=1 Tax=Desulfoluna spongiiphila TaxID=419481 RepID=A0A1G5HVD6_9BACT|nr:ATP-binding cassette, subfamily B, HlyB/CyaB [Desulfoluna spongiiphila]